MGGYACWRSFFYPVLGCSSCGSCCRVVGGSLWSTEDRLYGCNTFYSWDGYDWSNNRIVAVLPVLRCCTGKCAIHPWCPDGYGGYLLVQEIPVSCCRGHLFSIWSWPSYFCPGNSICDSVLRMANRHDQYCSCRWRAYVAGCEFLLQ